MTENARHSGGDAKDRTRNASDSKNSSQKSLEADNVEEGGKRLLIALFLNVGITVAQVIGGILSGSLSLLADAAHNGSDAASLGISYGARRIAQQPADRRHTFGYERAKLIGAMINLTVLFGIGLFLIYAAIRRFMSPPEVESLTMLVVGGIAFVEDAISTGLLWHTNDKSQNIRAAFIHLFADTLATLGIIAGALVIMFYEVHWVDPALTLTIAGYVLIHAYLELRETIALLMESAPPDFDYEAMVRALQEIENVQDLHHVHVWRLDEQRLAMEGHLVMQGTDTLDTATERKRRAKQILEEDFGIGHATLEIEAGPPSRHEDATIPRE